jgi:hypothetical protein
MILPFAGRFTLLVGIPGASVDRFGIVIIVNLIALLSLKVTIQQPHARR